MEVLISHGHPVDCRDAKGWPPLLYAHFVDHQDCVLALMRAKPAQVREGEGKGGYEVEELGWKRERSGRGRGAGGEGDGGEEMEGRGMKGRRWRGGGWRGGDGGEGDGGEEMEGKR